MKSQLLTLTPEECDKLLSYLVKPQNDHTPTRIYNRNYTIALLMLDAGLRVREVTKLRQDQLWFASAVVGALTVEKDQAKNKHERTIPISSRLDTAIHQMQHDWWSEDTALGERAAFYSRNCQYPLTTRQVQRIIKSAGAKSIGRAIHPHLLRHTFATRLMRNTSMRVVQELIGHKNLSSTQIYTHPNSEDRKKAIDSLNKNE
ncbi:Tyrosine recombinase XerC [subsurface metagenome]